MKKLSIIVVAVMLGLLVAPLANGTVQAANPPLDRESAILAAADWLVANQNDDGGFAWKLTDPSSISSHNVLGVAAMGILKAYGFEPNETYQTALAEAYGYVVDTAPVYTWDGSKYVESAPKGVDSFPDITFLIWLAQIADDDGDLLAAINALQDPDVTAADIAGLAKTRWDDMLLYKGATQQDPANGTATSWAEAIRDVRHGSYDALIPWDLEAGVKAALALHEWFPGQGYAAQASEIVEVLHASVDDGTYFDSNDDTQTDYVLGLTGAIEAYTELGVYTGEAEALKDKLLGLQQDDGSWMWYGDTPAAMSVQSTAYAVMALARQGDEDALMAARKGADWLVKNQRTDGGWYSEDGTGDEYLEIDSEAAWALASLDGPVTIGENAYYSIQSAIDAAAPGDTINVAPGLYTERIVIDKPLTLLGATHGINKNGYEIPEDYAWDTSVESVVSYPDPIGLAQSLAQLVDVQSSDVTVKGFVFQIHNARCAYNGDNLFRVNATTGDPAAPLTNIVVENNVLGPATNVELQDGTCGRMNLYLASPTYPTDPPGITNSRFAGNTIFGAMGNGNNVFVWGAAQHYDSTQNANYSGTVIEDNAIFGSHRSGIEIAGGVTGLTIRDNRIYDNSSTNGGAASDELKYGNGIVVIRIASDASLSAPLGAEGLTIEGNEIYGNEKNAIYLGPVNSDHIIQCNHIHDNGWDGIRVDLDEGYHSGAVQMYDRASNILARNNRISANDVAAQVLAAGSTEFVLDAQYTWWGSTEGPADSGVNRVGAHVDTSNWLSPEPTTCPFETGDVPMLWVEALDSTTDENGEVGTSVMLDPGGFEVFGFEFIVNYDADVLSAGPDDVQPGDFFQSMNQVDLEGTSGEGGYTWIVQQPEAGKLYVRVTLLDDENDSVDGIMGTEAELVNVSFTAAPTGDCAEFGDVWLSDEILSQKEDGDRIHPVTVDGPVTITAYKLVPVSGVVELQGRNVGKWGGVAISLDGTNNGEFEYDTTTDSAGAWAAQVACGTYDVYVDMNAYLDAESKAASIVSTWERMVKLLGGNADERDESANIIFLEDVVAIANVIGQSTPDPATEGLYPDINADDTINILDLVLAGINYTEEGPKEF